MRSSIPQVPGAEHIYDLVKLPPEEETHDDRKRNPEESPSLAFTDDTETYTTPFKHNPVHDLESMFWLALYVLLFSTFARNGAVSEEAWTAYMDHVHWMQNMFGNTEYRTQIMHGWRDQLVPRFQGSFPILAEQGVDSAMREIRDRLRSKYTELERDAHKPGYTIKFAKATGAVHRSIAAAFLDLSNRLKTNDVRIVIDPPIQEQRLRVAFGQFEGIASSATAVAANAASHADDDSSGRPRKIRKTGISAPEGLGV